MVRPRKAWRIGSAEKPALSVPDSIKTELEAKAAALIVNVLKPKHIQPPPQEQRFNYIIDIGTKWHRNYFYFFSTYACPGPNALSPGSKITFARMAYLGNAKFAVHFMPHRRMVWIIQGPLHR